MRSILGAVLVLVVGVIGCSDSDTGSSTPRFAVCDDGLTVADTATGLVWELKTGESLDPGATPPRPKNVCETAGCPDPHDVKNVYNWSATGTNTDGNVFTDFLVMLNTAPGFAAQTDWRIPAISELQSIMVGPGVLTPTTTDPLAGENPTAQPEVCEGPWGPELFLFGPPCIDPGFAAVGDSDPMVFDNATAENSYWSMSDDAMDTTKAWSGFFGSGQISSVAGDKVLDSFVRAVRTGLCSP